MGVIATIDFGPLNFGRRLARVRALKLLLLAVACSPSCNIEQDRRDARVIADRVHSQMQSGDFSGIYRESAPRFKSVGTEPQFISMMQQFFEQNGKLVKAQEVAYQAGIDSRAGRTHTLTFDVDYERGHARERLIFTRDANGQMHLWKFEAQPKD